jgi:hypothetical protein
MKNLLSRVRTVCLVAASVLLVLSAPGELRAQNATNHFTMVNPFGTAIAAAGQSNLIYFRSGGLNVSAPTATKLKNSPLGIAVQFSGSTVAVAGLQVGVAIQPSYDGVTFSSEPWWVVMPTGGNATNFSYGTNFSQALVGNAVACRIAAVTNGHASAMTLSNVTLNYFY